MKITIHGHHIDVGQAMETHIQDRMQAILDKYFNEAIGVTIIMDKDTRSVFRCHISMTVGKDLNVQATARDHEVYAAFDVAADKIAKQLRRYKRRLTDRHEQRETAEAIRALEYTLAHKISDEQLDQLTDQEVEEQSDAVVIAEIATNIQTMTVSDAAMRLDLSGNNALMFRNASHGEINMVYRRNDGHIGWIDPREVEDRKSKVA